MDILAIANPAAFSKTTRIKSLVSHFAAYLNVHEIWQYEIAGMLSQIGCISIPTDLLGKWYQQNTLTENEKLIISEHPVIGAELIANIPRMNIISKMIGAQECHSFAHTKFEFDISHPVRLGSSLINLAIEFDIYWTKLGEQNAAIDMLKSTYPDRYSEQVIDMLLSVKLSSSQKNQAMLTLNELSSGMILDDNVMTQKGVLLASKGQEITSTMIQLFRNYERQNNLVDQIAVIVLQY